MTFHPRHAMAAAATLVVAATMTIPSVASASHPHEDRSRLERACGRVAMLEERITDLLARLDGDETVRGSLLWLQTKHDLAVEGEHDDLAEVLANRLVARNTARDRMVESQNNVGTVRTLCAENDVEL